MRERLTVTFVLLTVLLCLLAFVARTYSLGSALRRDESEETHQAAAAVAEAVRLQVAVGGPVDAAFLQRFAGHSRRVEIHWRGHDKADVVATGDAFAGSADPSRSGDIWAAAEVNGGYVIVSQSADVVRDLLLRHGRGTVLFVLLLALLAGIVGFVMARLLSQPFRQLAAAARSLGRGRFDLDLPRTRIPEAREIADALRSSAGQLQERIAQDHSFAEHASHALRTPLTSLRLELDALALDEHLPADLRPAVERCVQRLDGLDEVAGELVRLARTPSLVAGAALPLRELAAACAQRWADELAQHDRTLTAAVEGDLDTTYTPGPVEHLHDLLLLEVLRRSRGDVRLVHEATEGGALRMRVVVREAVPARGGARAPDVVLDRVRAVVTALGGRLQGADFDGGLEILLPRR